MDEKNELQLHENKMLMKIFEFCFVFFPKGLPVEKKKKSRKYDDYIDLGAGYDNDDPFIDNTDAVMPFLGFFSK